MFIFHRLEAKAAGKGLGRGGQTTGVWGTGVSQRGPGAEPR